VPSKADDVVGLVYNTYRPNHKNKKYEEETETNKPMNSKSGPSPIP